MILSKIGQIDSAKSTELLTSAMKGYKVQVSDVLGIIDKLSAVDLNSATDVNGLATAMSRVASMANLSGVSMNKLLGYLAVVGETTKKDMASVGESFQTIFSRMGNIKVGKFTEGKTGQSLNDVESVLGKIGVKLRDGKNSFRDFGSVLDDVGKRWGSLSGVEKNAVAVAISGVRQRENFTVLMQNYSKALKYTEVAANSSGTAMQKFSAYEEGVEAKTKKLTASLQELATGTLNSSVIKGFLDLSNGLINITNNVGIFNVALMAMFGVIGAKSGAFKLLADQISLAMVAQTGYTAETTAAAFAEIGLTNAITATGTALKSFLLTNPFGWTVLGVSAIFALSKAYDYFNVTLEENQEKLEKEKSTYDESTSNVKSLETELKNCKSKLEELNNIGGAKVTKDGEQEKLEAQTQELQRQLDIEKEKQRIAGLEAEKTATTTLGTKINSQYNSKTVYSDVLGYHVDYQKVTRNVELDETIDKYDKLSKKYSELEKEQQKLANSGKGNTKEFKNNDKELTSLSDKMDKTRKYANDLATKMQKESESLIGATKSGDAMKITVDKSLSSYEKWLNKINKTNDSLSNTKASANTASDAVNTLSDSASKATKDQNKAIDDYQSSLKTIQSAISDISSLSSSDIMDLMQQFPEYTDTFKAFGVTGVKGVGDLKGALSGLATQLYENLDPTLKTNKAFKSMSNEAVTASLGVSDLAVVTDAANKKTKLNSEQVKFLTNKYDGLRDKLVKAKNGWYLEVGAIDTVQKAINTLKTDYITAVQNMTTALNTETAKQLSAFGVNLAMIGTQKEALYDLRSTMANNTNPGAQDAMSEYEKFIKNYYKSKKLVDKLLKSGLDTKSSDLGKDKTETKGSSSSSGEDKYLKKVQAKIDTIKHEETMGEISESTYYNKLDKINDKYFKNKKKYLSEYRQYEEEVHTGRINLAKDATEKDKALDEESATNKENGIKSMFDNLDHSYAMGEIKEKEYQKKKWAYAKTYYKNDKDYLEEWQKAQEDHYEWEEKQEEERLQKQFDKYDESIDKYDKTISEAKRLEGLTKDGSNEQLILIQTQLQATKDKISSLKAEINKLNKELSEDKDNDKLKDRIKDLNSELESATDDMLSYNNDIADSIKAKYETEVDSLNDLSDAYHEALDAAKKLLEEQQKADEYKSSIDDKTEDINKTQNRITELTKAAESGDREAAKEKASLEEDLADKKKDLAKTQKDHEVELAEDAIDEAGNAYDKANKAKITAIESLYDKESELIKKAASLSTEEFTKALDNIKTYAQANSLDVSDSLSKAMTNTSSSITNNASSNNSSQSTIQPNSDYDPNYVAILNILQHASGTGASNSDLNQHVKSLGYNPLSYSDMAKLASFYGITGITADNVKNNTSLKTLLMKKLIASGFKNGGTVDASGVSGSLASLIKSVGEDGLALVKHGDEYFTGEKASLVRDLIKNIEPLRNMTSLTTSNISNAIINKTNNSSPTIQVILPSNTTIDNSAINNYRKLIPELTNAVSEQLLNVQRQYK